MRRNLNHCWILNSLYRNARYFCSSILVIFVADTTRKPRAGEEDGRGKSVTNRIQTGGYVYGSFTWKEEIVLNDNMKIPQLLTRQQKCFCYKLVAQWITPGPPDWPVLSLTNELQCMWMCSPTQRHTQKKSRKKPKIWEIYHCPLHWSRKIIILFGVMTKRIQMGEYIWSFTWKEGTVGNPNVTTCRIGVQEDTESNLLVFTTAQYNLSLPIWVPYFRH